MQPNYSACQSPYINIVSEAQAEEIIQAAFLILERTGVKVTHPAALKMLGEAGAQVAGDRVRLPRWLMCVQKSAHMCAREATCAVEYVADVKSMVISSAR